MRDYDPICTFLNEIGRIPLLTPGQEVIKGTLVQAMMSRVKAKETLTQQLHREPTHEEWVLQVDLNAAELAEIMKRGQQAKCQMVEANLRLVVVIAKRYRGRGVEFLDLIQEGAIGLQRAVERFDPNQGFRLSSYASWWIRSAITRAIRDTSHTVRLPLNVYEQLSQIKKATWQLSQQMGRTPTIGELATKLEKSPSVISQYLKWAQPTVSLNQLLGNDSENELGELVPDKCATPDELLMQSSATDELQQMMAQLTPQQTQVLSLRFGLVDGNELTFSEIGKKFNVSKQRVHQVAVKALALMKTSLQATPKLPVPETEAVVSDDSTPKKEDIWSVILPDERSCDANAGELLLLINEQQLSCGGQQ